MLTPSPYKFCTHINKVFYPQPSSPLPSAMQHQHCYFPCLSLLLEETHASLLHSAPYRLFIQFSHTHLTFLSLARGNFRGCFTLLGFSQGELYQGTAFFRRYCLEEKSGKEWGSEAQTWFLPGKDWEKRTQIFRLAKLFLYDRSPGSFREESERTVPAFLSSLDE